MAPTKRHRTGGHLACREQPRTKSQKLARQMADEKDSPTDDQTATTSANKPFRFFDLPPELRNAIYSCILENHTVRISKRSTLQINSAVIRASKQVHSELGSMLLTHIHSIEAVAKDWKFFHIMTFFDRLSRGDPKSTTAASGPKGQEIKINLVFANPAAAFPTDTARRCFDRWMLWSLMSKRGFALNFVYEWLQQVPSDGTHITGIEKALEIEKEKKARRAKMKVDGGQAREMWLDSE